ncbi:hypothetical protein HJG60_009579 [Phyllostomus discolor]|uniref:Uncharacterized protein n=1 Tax=Phyllostomus discolor TaxID=89673 RepID=A0A833YC47_9CHIR|nr:hypothetical protein HJG60_009579 [Phyllostomus discolor]
MNKCSLSLTALLVRPPRQDTETARAPAGVFPKKVGAAGGTTAPPSLRWCCRRAASEGRSRRRCPRACGDTGGKGCVGPGGEGAPVSEAPRVPWVGRSFRGQDPSKASCTVRVLDSISPGISWPCQHVRAHSCSKDAASRAQPHHRSRSLRAVVLGASQSRDPVQLGAAPGLAALTDASELLWVHASCCLERCPDGPRRPGSHSLPRRRGPGSSPALAPRQRGF